MRRAIYYIIVFSMAMISCEDDIQEIIYVLPPENIDVEEAVIEEIDSVLVEDVVYTLTNEDYPSEKNYYASQDEANGFLSGLLKEKFPDLSVKYENGVIVEKSTVAVTFNYEESFTKDTHTLIDTDYDAVGLTKLVTEDDFNAFLEYKFPDLDTGDAIELTYKGNPDFNSYELTPSDYNLVGNATNYFQMPSETTGKLEDIIEHQRQYIETILLANFPEVSPGTIYNVAYTVYEEGIKTASMKVVLDSKQPEGEIKKYTLTDADYDAVGNGFYDNFDVRPDRAEELESVRQQKIETILLANFPNAIEGDFYKVTYAAWTGQDETMAMTLYFDGENYVKPNAYLILDPNYGIERTSSFVYADNRWNRSYVFTPEDYAVIDVRDKTKEEAVRLIGIYLERIFPYEPIGDHIIIQYETFDGDVTKTENAQFSFNGTRWDFVPDIIIIEDTFNYEYNGEQWLKTD